MSQVHYESTKKPPRNICPRQFCFNWVPPDGWADLSGKLYGSFEEAIYQPEDKTYFPDGGCGAGAFGPCCRVHDTPEAHDLYEPHEYQLKHANLPWFYFIPTPEKLAEEFREEYIHESEKLWGKEHWNKNTPA